MGGTAVTQSAWRLFAVAATAALIFGTSGWILALFGGRKALERDADRRRAETRRRATGDQPGSAIDRYCSSCCISWRAASAIEPDSDG